MRSGEIWGRSGEIWGGLFGGVCAHLHALRVVVAHKARLAAASPHRLLENHGEGRLGVLLEEDTDRLELVLGGPEEDGPARRTMWHWQGRRWRHRCTGGRRLGLAAAPPVL